MRLDVAQFQDMWKAGQGNNCWTTSEQPSSTTAISITTTTSFTSSMAITTTCGSSTCTPATTSHSTTHPPCCLASPSRAHWQPQHGCLREPPAPPAVQACAHAPYYIYRPYNHPHRVCLYSLATSYPMGRWCMVRRFACRGRGPGNKPAGPKTCSDKCQMKL